MANYIILLPTSETKKKGGDENKPYRIIKNFKQNNSFITLESERDYLYSKLREAITNENDSVIEKIFDLKDKNLHNAIEVNLDLLNEPTMYAVNRFSGVMFSSIEYDKLKEKQKNNFDESVIFLDSLFGLLRPKDLIPEYKLKMDSLFLDINIIEFWKEKLSGYFNYLFKEKIVISLLPQSHQKIISISSNSDFLYISFCEKKENKLVNVGHNSKKLKGELINYLISNDFIKRVDLENFIHSQGYIYSKEFSNEKNIIFIKK